METGTFIIPNNDSELVEMYFDKEKYTELANAHGRIRGVLDRRLAGKPAADPELDGMPTGELEERASELFRQMYAAAFRCFAERICSEQRSICSRRFMIAPLGGEEGWIERAPMPCVYEKGRYEMLRDYWNSLDAARMRELMGEFPDVFGEGDSRESQEDFAARREEDKEDDDTLMDFCSERWDELPEEEKMRVYRYRFPMPV